VEDWIACLLFRNPFTRVPRTVRLAWISLWLIALFIVSLAVATVLPRAATLLGVTLWEWPPLSWFSAWEAWHLVLLTVLVAAITRMFVVPYFGRVVRYTRATPENIAARRNIRERGLLRRHRV
jgi:hypothetical protein